MDRELVKGKIAVCDSIVLPSDVGSLESALGIIMQDGSPKDLTAAFPLPASHLGTQQRPLISSYLNLTR